MKRTVLLAALLSATAMSVAAQELRIGLAEDPDVLDPDQSRTFVGRIVYTALCDKLIDISPELDFVPQLATEWGWNDAGTELTMKLREGVVFHDGTPLNAAAVVANIDRSLNLPESRRKSEIASITGVEATGDHEVRITLAAPDATLLAQLADRAGMMVSPTAAEAAGTDFGANPVCSGPFKFVERVAQDRIVLEAFPDYWNAGEIHLDRVVYLPIPDGTVRFANLQSGDLDLVERLQATDLAQAQSAAGIKVETAVSLGYDGITFNVGNGAKADNPFGKDGALLRQAFSVALDREALNQVVFDGVAAPGNQSVPPSSQWYVADFPVPTRDIEKAKALLAEAGHADGVTLAMQHPNSPEQLQVAQVIQAMVAEAGISVSLQAKEFASMLADQTAGEYQASLVGWSGRVDPDGNLHQFVTTAGGLNDSKYANPEVDRILDAARQINDVAERKALYTEATAILDQDLPIIYLYHDTWIWALKDGVSGFVPYPDAMIRLQGVTKAE